MTTPAQNEPDGTLENWKMIENNKGIVRYSGNIYGDRKARFPDGEYVTTSPVWVCYHNDGIIHTQNSVYKLGKPAIEAALQQSAKPLADVPLNGESLSDRAETLAWVEAVVKDKFTRPMTDKENLTRYMNTIKTALSQPSPDAENQVDVDDLANFIRTVDGNNDVGAGDLAEQIINYFQTRGLIAGTKAGEWLPIETAPKDQTWILVCVAGMNMYPSKVCSYGAKLWRLEGPYEDHDPDIRVIILDMEPTHWQPLPTPPQADREAV